MNKLTIAIIFLLSLLLFVGKGDLQIQAQDRSTNNKIETFKVDSRRSYCSGIVPKYCLQVKRDKSKKFQTMYDEIENFKFIPGYRYILKVEVETVKFPPKDTSGYKYYLKEIVSREKVLENAKHSELFLHKWELIPSNGQKIKGRKPFIIFNKNRSGVGGYSGCNSFGGSLEVNREKIAVSNLIQTKRACADMREVEFPFMANLKRANSYKAEIDRLYLYQNGKLVLEFKPSLSR